MNEQWQKDLAVANSTGADKVMELWRRWQSEGVPDGAASTVAKVLIGLFRYAPALEILESLGDDLKAQQQRALTIAKLGRVDEAIEMLERLKVDGHVDPETIGILAGRYKQRGLASAEGSADLRAAYFGYLDAYETTDDSYNGINAASLALGLGDSEESEGIASKIVEQLENMPRSELDHWQFATLGEAYLLLGKLKNATRWYGRAVAAAPNAVGDIATMRRQARRNLENLGLPRDSLDDVMVVKRVVAFTGHMVDAAGRPEPRFPEEQIGDVRQAVRQRLADLKAGLGVCSAAAGSDLLFLEELLERGGHAHVVLPFPVDDFIDTSVRDWKDQFVTVMEDPRVNVTILADQRPPDDQLETAFETCNLRIIELARELAHALDEDPVLVAVWDGKTAGGVGGTADVVKAWERLALGVEVIPIGSAPTAEKGAAGGTTQGTPVVTRNLLADDPEESEGGGGGRARATGYGARYCLAIGIEQYDPPLGRLANPKSDAEEVAQVLTDMYGFHTTSLIDADASKDRISEAVEDVLVGKVREEDLVVLFFAGHGHTVYSGGKEEGYVVPFGAAADKPSKMLSMATLAAWSARFNARHVLYIFDSCFSGNIALGATGVRVAQDPQQAAISICAGTSEQVVADGGADNHSVFTHHLLHALREGVSDGGRLTATKLYSYIRDRVEEVAPQQTPTLGQLPSHQGGEIELERVPPV